MIPPTPTPFGPVPTQAIEFPAGVGEVWSNTGIPISLWNQFGQFTIVIQVVVLLGLILAAIFVVLRIYNSLNNEDEKPAKVNVTVKAPTYKRRRRR